MSDVRTITIQLNVQQGYRSLVTENLTLPASVDITRIGVLVERKLASMLETVNDFYPPETEPESPITSDSTIPF